MDKVLQKRFFLVIFAVCIAFLLFFMGTFAFIRLNHDHRGGECSVCLLAEAARNVFKALVLINLIALVTGSGIRKRTLRFFAFALVPFQNPVLMKVKFTL
jgi:hypothetical protein